MNRFRFLPWQTQLAVVLLLVAAVALVGVFALNALAGAYLESARRLLSQDDLVSFRIATSNADAWNEVARFALYFVVFPCNLASWVLVTIGGRLYRSARANAGSETLTVFLDSALTHLSDIEQREHSARAALEDLESQRAQSEILVSLTRPQVEAIRRELVTAPRARFVFWLTVASVVVAILGIVISLLLD